MRRRCHVHCVVTLGLNQEHQVLVGRSINLIRYYVTYHWYQDFNDFIYLKKIPTTSHGMFLIIVEMDIWHILLMMRLRSTSIVLTHHLHQICETCELGYARIDLTLWIIWYSLLMLTDNCYHVYLPPRMCITNPYMFLTIAIPSLKNLGKLLDMFLRFLIDELKMLEE